VVGGGQANVLLMEHARVTAGICEGRGGSKPIAGGDIRTHREGSGGGPVLDTSPDNREQIERGNELTEELRGEVCARYFVELLGRLRTMKPFGPLVAPLITSNHLRGE